MHQRRIRRVRFVGPDDEGYRDHSSRQAQEKRRLGRKVEASATSKVGLAFEEIVRRRLGQVVPLMHERILAYEIQVGRYGYEVEYLELDALSGRLGEVLWIFEIKATGSAKGALRGLKQLARARNVIARHHAHKMIALVLIWVDTGGVPFTKDPRKWARITELKDLNALGGWHGDDRDFALVRVSGDMAWNWATSVGVNVSDDLWEAGRREVSDARRLREQRVALREAGVAEAEWPAAVRAQPQRRLPGSYSTRTTAASETALSVALRDAGFSGSQEERQRRSSRPLPASTGPTPRPSPRSAFLFRGVWRGVVSVAAGGLLALAVRYCVSRWRDWA